ncbi:MAG: M56 family metallopeptidase, partial [Planctomycetota bacterium]
SWQALVFLSWLVGMLVLLALLVQRICFVKGLIAQSKPADERLLEMLDECRCRIDIRRNIDLRLSSNTLSPAVCGLFKPIILMPATVLDKLPPEKLKTILIHELAHIKRADIWINLLQTILQIAYFYNPFVWIANAMVRRTREQAVDEMVLVTLKPNTESCSNTLIDIAEMAFWRPNFSLRLIGVVESKKALERRIKHMLNRPIPKTEKLGIVGLFAIIIIGAIILPMGCNQPKQSSLETPVTEYSKESHIPSTSIINDDFAVPKEFVGHWKGQAKIIVNWTKQRRLAIDIEVMPNGKVTGWVGDSQFKGATLKSNRGWLGKKLNIKTDWMIRGDLVGPVIKNENITREYINLLFNDIDSDDKIKGGFHTSGKHIGNKETMVMSGARMVLVKIPAETYIPSTSTINEKGHIIDKIDYPFVNDQEVIGTWKAVDYVGEIEDFKVGEKQWTPRGGELFLHEMIFENNGSLISKNDNMPAGYPGAWTKGLVFYNNDTVTASKYTLKDMAGSTYMFYEWKSGDYTFRHRKPSYYVLKKIADKKTVFHTTAKSYPLKKETFFKKIDTLETKGEFFTEESIRIITEDLPLFITITESDCEEWAKLNNREYDVYVYLALSTGLSENIKNRQYVGNHFSDIRHPMLKLAWAIQLYYKGPKTKEVSQYLYEMVTSEESSLILQEGLGHGWEEFKNEIISHH